MKLKQFFKKSCSHAVAEEREQHDWRIYKKDFSVFYSTYFLKDEEIEQIFKLNEEKINFHKEKQKGYLGIYEPKILDLGVHGQQEFCDKCFKYKPFKI